ncbi:MAG: nucleotide exchange factor GrpE [Victivallaceae bacterium]|nr:nucleotide exchange factor GrpE [Victivallaceae bacterium]
MADEEKTPQENTEWTQCEGGTATPDAAETKDQAPEVAEEAAEAEKKEEVKELTPEEKLAELAQKYLYLQAEYQNYRKRVAKDIAETRALTVADTLTPFLTVFDYLSMADNAAVKSDNIDSIRQGLKMIIDQFFKVFEEIGVTPLESVNQKFDPKFHDAVAKEPSETVPEGTIIREWNRGFKLGERLLRPARVVVSSGAPQAENNPEKEEK